MKIESSDDGETKAMNEEPDRVTLSLLNAAEEFMKSKEASEFKAKWSREEICEEGRWRAYRGWIDG